MVDLPYVEHLTRLDWLMPRTYIRVLFVFEEAASTTQITQSLQRGLDRLTKQVPWLSGRVFPTPPTPAKGSSLEIRWSGNDKPTLVDKGSIAVSYKCAVLQNMPPEAIPSNAWPAPSLIDEGLLAAGAPVFAASVFRFADQAVGLCVCLHHNAVDATGFMEITRLWGQHVADPEFALSCSSQSRSELLSEALSLDPQETSSVSFEDLLRLHAEYSNIPPTMPEIFPSCTSKLFQISMRWTTILKELINKYTTEAPTTNTIICALIWSTVTRVRMQCNASLRGEMTRLATAVNGRKRIGENFSTSESPFFGNAVLYSLVNLPAEKLASSDEAPVRSLATICHRIAQAQSKAVINSRHIAETCHLAERAADRGPLYAGWDLFGSRDLMITSWADLDLYGVDFGDALRVNKFVRLPYMEADGVALILPRQRGVSQEVLEVVIALRRDHMGALGGDTMWQTLLTTSGQDGSDASCLEQR